MLNALGLEDSKSNPEKTGGGRDEKEQAIANALQRQGSIITGIGSRETPETDLLLLTQIAQKAEERGMHGRSGGAGGADLAFERGFKDPRNIDVIFPWRGFLPKNMTEEDVTRFLGRERPKSGPGAPVMLSWGMKAKAEEIAKNYHPAWEKCSTGARSLHTRNVPQVMGLNLDRLSDVVVCWTVDGKATGGTGQAIRIAMDKGIPIANLKNPDERKVVLETLKIIDPAESRKIYHQMNQSQSQGFGR